MKKLMFLLTGLVFINMAYSYDIKPALGINGVNLDQIDVDQMVQEKKLYESDPTQCSAIVYILYGSAKATLDQEEEDVIQYNDRIVSRDTIVKAKGFLMETVFKHKNKSTRAFAGGAIAYAFPRDPKISEWLFDQYFFHDLDARGKGSLLNIIKKGGYDDPYAKIVVKDGLMANSAGQVINAVSCISNNKDRYPEALPDLLASLLSLEERYKNNKSFELKVKYAGGISVCYLQLMRAISGYDEVKVYRPVIQKILKKNNRTVPGMILIQK